MVDPFDSAWLKWAWAVREARALEEDIRVFPDQLGPDGIGTTRCDYQPKHHRFAVVMDSLYVDLPPRWGLRLGSAVHNFHSCLDHIAWAVVERGKRPPSTLSRRGKAQVYFPISLTRENFNERLARNLPGASRTDIACVRRYQPYHRPASAERSSFAVLDRLSRLDKHRAIQLVAGYPVDGTYEVSYYRDCEITRHTRGDIRAMMEVGAEVHYIYVRKLARSDPEMRVKAHLSLQPAIEKRFWLNEWIASVAYYTRLVLEQFAQEPTDLLARLDSAG